MKFEFDYVERISIFPVISVDTVSNKRYFVQKIVIKTSTSKDAFTLYCKCRSNNCLTLHPFMDNISSLDLQKLEAKINSFE